MKLWDIPAQRVIASNENLNVISAVDTISFSYEDTNLFLIALRSGEVKLFNTRIKIKIMIIVKIWKLSIVSRLIIKN